MSTDRRIRASRANGALSHGPKTQAGKQRCRLNAVKTGAFAKSIVLKNESPPCSPNSATNITYTSSPPTPSSAISSKKWSFPNG